MPKIGTKGTKAYLFELPPDLIDRLAELAAKMGRSRKAELVLAIERHLAFPPAPPPPPAVIPLDPLPASEEAKPGPKRGRPRKGV